MIYQSAVTYYLIFYPIPYYTAENRREPVLKEGGNS